MADISLGKHWSWLEARGWQIKPATALRGTAAAYGPRRLILVKPAALNRPDTRIRRYVLEHEMWHAIEWEVCELGNAGDRLHETLGVGYIAAREIVADGAVLHGDPSRQMQLWVRASVAWHSKMGTKYRFAHLTAPAVLRRIAILNRAVTDA